MSALWQSWLHGDLPWLVLTLGAYLLAVWLYKRSNFYPLLVPVFTAVALVVAVLLATNTPYAQYRAGVQWLTFLIGPATVALAVPLFGQLGRIRQLGAKAGVVLNPGTPVDVVAEVVDLVDLVLLMSVNPGFGGQAFIPSTLDKLRAVRRRIDASDKSIRLEIDGGVKADNIAQIAAAGADTFVAGSAIFNAPDYAEVIAAMRSAVAAARK